MQITIAPYNPEWKVQFTAIKKELSKLLIDFQPIIEHFGSTSVPGLAAKPVIDVLVGIQNVDQLEAVAEKIAKNNKYIYYKIFNEGAPNRRLFVRLKDEVNHQVFANIYTDFEKIPHDQINKSRISHIHIWEVNTSDWIRHIAFREYLIAHDDIRIQYENLKKKLSQRSWKDGMEYNGGKNDFLKREEEKAVKWYKKRENVRRN